MDENEKPVNTKPYNLAPNVEAALAYLLTPITGVIVLLAEKDNKFVRFHAMQSILFGVVVFAASFIASVLTIVLIGIILIPVVTIASVVLWLLLMWKAYNNVEYELPILGKIAHNQVNK
ncbi:MAG: hypothetical protein UX79_C0024G0005 [candidate division WWE3 bacterium GW2011_GWB1_47_11]|uniref:DUF4870 domain-containing protein n=1 Tax=candidate division WWE3 bacterium GW2011_GWB1_47_11 TaxID=1619117 RepID=A0A0G1RIS6_UNCKA|nr:MAG: hypothetical protein UX79_C0024G0005 [candidate division WWE3 bacterium GW2011_GWB1_47_11]